MLCSVPGVAGLRAVALTALLLVSASALADDKKAPDAARVRAAAEQFDAGVAAFKAKDFEGAASHFEAADAAVPSPKALRQAIRARVEAGQGSRAATLAALALARYSSDEATAKLAKETMDKLDPVLHKVSVSCASPCVLAVGTRSVPGESNTRWVIYLDPGKESLSASFFGGASTTPQEVNAKAGGSSEVRFEPEEKGKRPPAPAPPKEASKEASKTTPPRSDPPPSDPPPSDPSKDVKPERKGISPVFFGIGAAATAGLGATTIWSGIDTKNNPGVDRVKAECLGKGPECPLYKEALAKQTRTNILIGATAGTAAVTVVLAIFTNWRGNKPKPPAEPTALIVDRGAILGARGAF